MSSLKIVTVKLWNIFVPFLLLSTSALDVSTSQPADPFIVGGSSIKIEEAPYQVSLRVIGSFECGGALVSADTVVTAAHCVYGHLPFALSVGIGSSDKLLARHVLVRAVHVHPDYKPYKPDVAVLKLASRVTFSSTIKAIPLAGREPTAGSLGLVTGWGAWFTGSLPALRLQGLKVAVMGREECKKFLPDLAENQICTSPVTGKSGCNGDSGGPLVVNGELAGVVSMGPRPCGSGKWPDVYANVALLKSFIQSYM